MNVSNPSLIASSVQNPYVISNGLVGYWSMNEATGSSVKDYSGNGIDSSFIVSGITFVPGITSNAIRLNNTGYAYTPVTNKYQNQNFTVAFWVYPYDQTKALVTPIEHDYATSPYQNWVIQSEAASTTKLYYLAWWDGAGTFQPSGQYGATSGLQYTVNMWQHVAYVKSGTSLIGYRNGSACWRPGAAGNANVAYTAKRLMFGECIGGTGRTFYGLLDDIRIYNRALNESEVQALTLAGVSNINRDNHPYVNDWLMRVAGQASQNTVNALNTFMSGSDAAGLTSKMKTLNCYVPDNLLAASTPLIRTYGYPIWNNLGSTGFVASDLTVNGLIGGANKYFDSGVVGTTCGFSAGNGGLSLYQSTANNNQETEMGDNGGFSIYTGWSAGTYFDCWNTSGGRVTTGNSAFAGFYTANRTSSVASGVYKANSVTPFALLVGGTGQSGIGTPSANNLYVHLQYGLTGTPSYYSTKRFSFAAYHDGLDAAQGQALYNLVQTLRTNLGGGYV
jgi:hypothetical protein